MSFDYSKLNGRIAEVCGTQAIFAQQIGLSEKSVSDKINNKVGWTQKQIEKCCEVLSLSENDILDYFFKAKVQKD